jgi:hypothetical protein
MEGSRCSGEYTTSVGNSKTNVVMIRYVFRGAVIKVIVNGDDSVVIMEYEDWRILFNEEFIRIEFKKFGMDTKIELVTLKFEEISFCQCNPVLINGVYKMVRNPIRVLSRIQYTDLRPEQHESLIRGLGYCEVALNSGVPILSKLGEWLISLVGTGKINKAVVPGFKLGNYSYSDVTMANRWSFYEAFGISPIEQISIENTLKPVGREISILKLEKEINKIAQLLNKQHGL